MFCVYWQGDGITLYLGDCREVTEWLAADVLVTDPPYGIDWTQVDLERPGHASSAHAGIIGDKDTVIRDAALTMWDNRPAIVFGHLRLTPPAGIKHVAIYQKPPDAGNRWLMAGFRRDIEAIYFMGPWPVRLVGGGRESVLRTNARSQGNPWGVSSRYGHPHAKPVDVMETLIAACPPGVIADPFAGSGSTLVAARNQGRQAVGVELDERYCEQAARRLDQGLLAEVTP